MDDARTQRTLDALADLYLTGPNPSATPVTPSTGPSASATSADTKHTSSQQAQTDLHSAANTGPRDSAPLRLPPKLRIRHAPAPTPAVAPKVAPAVMPATPAGMSAPSTAAPARPTTQTNTANATGISTPSASGPARPWREVRQERRDQQAANDSQVTHDDTHDSASDVTSHATSHADSHTDSHMDHLLQDMTRRSAEGYEQGSQNEPSAAPGTPAASATSGDELGALAGHMQAHEARESTDAPGEAPAEHQPDDHAGDQSEDQADDSHEDHSPFVFPSSASRSKNIAASGVMTDEADGPTQRQAGLTLTSQAVYLGNLPGFAGPWLAQYAQLLAVKHQRVAIVHMTEEIAEVQLVSPLGVEQVEPAGEDESIIDLFERLALDADCPLTQWLVHLPMPLTQASIELGHDLDGWTLLSGADDMAVAGGMQWLERMLQNDRRKAFRQVGVSVMGSDPSRGQAVADKLTAASRDDLSGPVQLRASRRQMAPVNIQSLGVFAPAMEMWAELVAYLSSIEETSARGAGHGAGHAAAMPQPGATPQPTRRPASANLSTAAATGSDSFRIPPGRRVSPQRQSPAQLKASQQTEQPTPAASAPATPASPSTPAAPVTPAASTPSAVPPAQVADASANVATPASAEVAEGTFADIAMETPAAMDTQASHGTAQMGQATQTGQATQADQAAQATTVAESVAAKATAQASTSTATAAPTAGESPESLDSLDLVRWITPGAIALEARCPYQPTIQLALDQAGLLHVMAAGDDAREVAMALLEVRQWAVDHLSVLCLTLRQCRFDMAAEPAVHLFATDGIAATKMTRSLNASIKLHLLQQAHIGTQSTWIASPLN